jgi:Holliday junction resolvase RusA-like endonuclease
VDVLGELERGLGEVVAFVVDGAPAPQGSKVARTSRAGGTYVHESNRPALDAWRASVATRAREAMAGRPPLTGPLELDVAFMFGRPRAHYRTGKRAGELKASAPIYCSTRPDLDKLLRAVGDAITGIVVVDDAAIVEVRARKAYGSPAAHIAVRVLSPIGG